MTEISSLLTLALPALTGAVAVALGGKFVETDDLYPLFFLASLLIDMFNNTWMQLTGFTRHKYAEILPKLYKLTERDGPHFGEYALQKGIMQAMFGAMDLGVGSKHAI